VRGGDAVADVGEAVARVVVLVAAEGRRMEAALAGRPEQLRGHVPLGRTARLGHLEVDRPPVAILHLAVLGERAGVKAWLHQAHVQEPPEQEVVL
jgi:hypothetical protein